MSLFYLFIAELQTIFDMAQSSITNFFKKSTSKRNTEDDDNQSKRQKIEELPSDVKVTTEPIGSFNATLSNIGTTWFNALESEFKKDYFQKLSSFLEVERKNHTIYPPQQEVREIQNSILIEEIKKFKIKGFHMDSGVQDRRHKGGGTYVKILTILMNDSVSGSQEVSLF